MKAIKILFRTILWLVAILVVALLALPLWFGPVAKTVANEAVPKVVGTDFHLGHIHLNPYTARFELGDLQLANPAGYSEKYAVKLGGLVFDAETMSLATDIVHIEEITVKDVFVSLVSGGENKVDNFKQIQYNVAGGKEKFKQAEAEAKAAEAQTPSEPQVAAEAEKPAKKIIIDRLHVSGLKVQYGFLPIALPSITLTDIGRKSGGVTAQEAGQEIWAGILKAAGVVGDQLKALGALTGDAIQQAADATAQATEAAGKAAESAATAAGKVTDAVGDGAKAVGDGAKAVGDAAGKAVGDGAKAVGDAAGKALDAINKLW